MSKLRTTGERIKQLMDSRHEKQAEFALHFGVKRTAISAWIHNDPDRKPSAAAYLKLAMLADKSDDRAYFLGHAGVDQQAIISLADEIRGSRYFEPQKGGLIAVPAVTRPRHDGLRFKKGLPFSADLPTLRPEKFFIIGKNIVRPFAEGDIILLGSSLSRAGDLRPFWGEIVLVSRSSPCDGDWEQCVGKLLLEPFFGESREGPWLWVAKLQPWLCLHSYQPYTLGYWEDGLVDPLGKIPEDIRRNRARSALRLKADYEVVGRVVGWLKAERQANLEESET